MKNKHWIVILMALVLAVMMCPQSLALWGWTGRGADPRSADQNRMERVVVKKLGLSDAQKKQYKTQQDKLQQEAKAIRDKIKKLSEKLRSELQKDISDRNAIHATIAEINKLRSDIQIKRMDLLLDLQKILTKEQREKFKKMLDRSDRKGLFGGRGRHQKK
jgi:Spy/CpxP family protein refolding chaperone